MPQNSSESETSLNYLERNPICANRKWLLTCAVVVFEINQIRHRSWKYPAKIFVGRSIFHRNTFIGALSCPQISAHKDGVSFSLLFLCASQKTHRQTVSASAVNLLRQKRTLAETLCLIWARPKKRMLGVYGLYGPRCEKTCLCGFENNKGADQPAQSDQRLCYSLIEKYHI